MVDLSRSAISLLPHLWHVKCLFAAATGRNAVFAGLLPFRQQAFLSDRQRPVALHAEGAVSAAAPPKQMCMQLREHSRQQDTAEESAMTSQTHSGYVFRQI